MILPIYAFGQNVLKKVAVDIDLKDPELASLISDMWETMYNAKGIGLAAPQVGKSVRIFLVDTAQIAEEGEDKGLKEVFINAQVIQETGDTWSYEEGCLSIPRLTGDVERPEKIEIKYYDADMKEQHRTFQGMEARVIQHEYDHIEGILFTERLKPLKKRLMSRKLDHIKKGNIDVDYKMKFKK